MIQLNNLQKVINQRTALDIADFRVASGEITAVVGPTGSGKDVLFQLLIGQSRPTVGEIQLAGLNPHTEKGLFSRQVGVLFAKDTLYKRQSVKGNLEFLCRLRGLPKSQAAKVMAQVGLADHANERVAKLPSLQEMKKQISEAGEPVLGLAFPDDFDARAQAGVPIELTGYVAHWVEPSRTFDLIAFFEEQISQTTGQPVHINTDGHTVYPQPDAGGRPFMSSMTLVIAVVFVGAFVVPYLMIEEKETHTMETLLVSPARYSEIVAGKAVAGLFYCLTAVSLLFLFNRALINLWGVAVGTAVVGALFTVALGLLMGILFDDPTSVNLWLGAAMMVLLLPMLLAGTMGPHYPAVLRAIIPWIPSAALAQVFRASFSNTVAPSLIWANLGSVAGIAALVFALVVWRVRRMSL